MSTEAGVTAVIGVFITGLGGLLFWFVQRYFQRAEKDQEKSDKKIEKLGENLSSLRATSAEGYTKVASSITDLERGIRSRLTKLDSEVSQVSTTLSGLARDQAKAEGRMDEHINMITSYIQTMGHMSRQIDALFRFVDNQPRPSDSHREK